MAFCYNCGKKLKDGSKFCTGCGVSQEEVEEVNTNDSSVRKQEFVGTVKKCPNCGEDLKSLTGICPSCGHEINSKTVNKSLKEFTDKLYELENKTEGYSVLENKGWSSWNGGGKLGWILLNMFLFLIPLVFYYYKKLFSMLKAPKLVKNEKELTYFIQNYQFPNDRESILSALIYIRDKVNFISNSSSNDKTYYWTKIWADKARELKSKSDILFKNDSIVDDCYSEIITTSEKSKKKLIIKTTLIITVITLFLIFIFASSSKERQVEYNKKLNLPTAGIVEKLPKVEYKNGNIITDSSDTLEFDIYNVKEKDFDDYVDKCKNSGFNINYSKNSKIFRAKNKDGYNIKIKYDEENEKITVRISSVIHIG